MNTLTLLSDAKYFDEGNSKFAELRSLLDSKHQSQKLEAMKRLMAMITIGRDVSSFFPDVVKNVVVESQEVKKLVYMYLIHYAEQNQELALLTINTFQKDLQSSSQRVRANAMKAMSSIRIPVAVPLVMLALKAAVKDQSSYVRRAAAAAIPKVWAVDQDQHELLVELVVELLTNNEPLVLGSAIFAFNAVCPDRIDLIHPHFRKICHLLADFDEWGQIITLDLLLRYGRTQFLDPITASSISKKNGAGGSSDAFDRSDALSPMGAKGSAASAPAAASSDLSIFNTVAASSSSSSSKKAKKDAKAKASSKKSKKSSESFYSDEDDSAESTKSSSGSSDDDSDDEKSKKNGKKKNPNPPALAASSGSGANLDLFGAESSFAARKAAAGGGDLLGLDDEVELDEDHQLLLKQASQLLQSSNTGVIVGVTSLMWSLAPKAELAKIVKPLVRLSRNKRNIQFIVLTNIATMACALPTLFRPYLKDFFIWQHEPRYIKDLKLDILTCITSDASIATVLKEFTVYTQDPDKSFVQKCITAIGRCAQGMPEIAERCIRGLMAMVTKPGAHPGVVAQSVVVIRQLLQSNSAAIHPSLLGALAKLLDTIAIPGARLAIVWMVGEYRDQIPKLAPDVLRKLAKTFPTEAEGVKVQILNLAVKLFLSNPKQVSLVFKYIMDLCRYDANIDLRDRARMMRALFFKKKAASDSAAGSQDHGSQVKEHFKSILLTAKPAPKLVLPFFGRDKWILGTLTHALNQPVPAYKELPDFPTVKPSGEERKPKVAVSAHDDSKRSTHALYFPPPSPPAPPPLHDDFRALTNAPSLNTTRDLSHHGCELLRDTD